jgi:hypothetical protein
MAKSKNAKSKATAPETELATPHTLASIIDSNDLRFKICALIYDLKNTKDQTSQTRLSSTTDPRYLSAPYFSPTEAELVKSALVDGDETVEQTLTTQFENFFSKRSASGDFRPCGPHDMVPIYLGIFGMEVGDLEGIEGRLRRSGLPAC